MRSQVARKSDERVSMKTTSDEGNHARNAPHFVSKHSISAPLINLMVVHGGKVHEDNILQNPRLFSPNRPNSVTKLQLMINTMVLNNDC